LWGKPRWARAKGWALYFPLDRVAASDHQNWFTESPDLAWNDTKTICDYLDYEVVPLSVEV
jgi:hypothetical protein